MSYNFPVTRTTHPKPRPEDETKLGFAKYFTDHMFVMDYDEGQGWHDGRVVPHEPFAIEPASCVLHYAQMMFEGMKAYRRPDGVIQLFRPDMHSRSARRPACCSGRGGYQRRCGLGSQSTRHSALYQTFYFRRRGVFLRSSRKAL